MTRTMKTSRHHSGHFRLYNRHALSAILLYTSLVYGSEYLPCPRVAEDQRPALLFIDGSIHKSDLKIALQKVSGDATYPHVLSADSMEISQLANAVFLITTHDDLRKGRVFAVNFDTGRMRCLADSTTIHCLRSLPDRNMAVLLDVQPQEDKMAIYDLSFDTLKMTLRYSLSRRKYEKECMGIGMKISPDLRYIAFVRSTSPTAVRRWSTYSLRLLDLSTGHVDELADNIGVLISSLSSFAFGTPPIEWLDEKELLYQDMDKPEKTDIFDHNMKAAHRFKSIGIEKREVRELMACEVPLSLDGGSLNFNPLNKDLVFRDKWIVDLAGKSLQPAISPFAVRTVPKLKQTRISEGSEPLYSGGQRCVYELVSASRANFAYSLRPWQSNSLFVELYSKSRGMPEPVKTATGPYLPVRPAGWIE